MDPRLIYGVIGLSGFVVLLILGMRIAFAAAFAGFCGLWFLLGWTPAVTLTGSLPWSTISHYEFAVLPLFLLMGHFAFHSGVTNDIFWVGRLTVGRLPGGLALATVLGGAGFAACCGSSTASTAILGKVAVPEMESYGYDKSLATGTVAAVSTLAAVIPPSGLAVIYGIITETSIGKLLIAGIIPGIVSALIYGVMIFVRCSRNPTLAPPMPGLPLKDTIFSLWKVWGVVVLGGLVIIGLYTGIFTPTETGAAGSLAAFIMAIARRRLGFQELRACLIDTGRTTCMIFLIIIGILIFARFLSASRLPNDLAGFLTGLPVHRMVILIGILLMFFVLGMFMDAIAMLLLTMPVILPAVLAMEFDPIWFGMVVAKTCEIALITPPVGLNVYVMKGVTPHVPIGIIFRGIIPFALMDIVTLALYVVFPQIILFLPSRM